MGWTEPQYQTSSGRAEGNADTNAAKNILTRALTQAQGGTRPDVEVDQTRTPECPDLARPAKRKPLPNHTRYVEISHLQAGEDVKSCDTYPALARNILQRNGIEPARQQTGSIRREGAAPLRT